MKKPTPQKGIMISFNGCVLQQLFVTHLQ